ncbi:hypothetical protein K2173_028195 [Erythroxylum novogranatense]|uniref:Uncharacterized protein n=1 Tax=Erythroxylum novogranatense TaxID=1862640 RepID=A0AAV8U3V1_9ROSI|nr:hypothetical protein K2173_028195 [Erythroxylum novogranatense]
MNWIRTKLFKPMNEDQESISSTAIAATAFAICSLEEDEISGAKDGFKKEAKTKTSHASKLTKRFSYKKTKNPGEGSSWKPKAQNHKGKAGSYALIIYL